MKTKIKTNKLKTIDMEIALAEFFEPRINLVVPNISWGIGIHECDLFVLTKSGYAYEVEIKVSMADLKKDCEKHHQHLSNKIKKFYFAIPYYMVGDDALACIPARAGIIVVDARHQCAVIREAEVNNSSIKFSDEYRFKIARLGALRIWTLKRKIVKILKRI